MTRHEDGMGGSITILEHGSTTAPMKFRMVMPKGMSPPAPEMHPAQTEDFLVLRGELDLGIVNGRHVIVRAGETFHLAAGVYHLPANKTDGECEFEAVLTPGLEAAPMFTDLYAAFRQHTGLGRFARIALTFRRYTSSIRFKTPIAAVMTVVGAISRLVGVKLNSPYTAPAARAPDAAAPQRDLVSVPVTAPRPVPTAPRAPAA